MRKLTLAVATAIAAAGMVSAGAVTTANAVSAKVDGKTLPATWYGQETSYWCGPGSTKIAISARKSPPSQSTLARYMGTTTNGTDHIGLVSSALNNYLGTSHYRTRNIPDPAGASHKAQLKKDLVASVNAGYALVGNVVSGWRPPGYPTGTIYHYVAIIGYAQNGDSALIADPAGRGAAGPRWQNVPSSYWVTTDNLGRWIGGKGYAF